MTTFAALQQNLQLAAQQKDWVEAQAIAQRAREQFPNESMGFLSGSFIALMNDDKRTALDLVDHWLANHPKDVACRIQRCECLWGLNQTETAIEECQLLASESPEDPAALAACADFLTFARESRRALALYDQVLAKAPQIALHWIKRGLLHRELGEFEAALSDFNEAIRLEPQNGEAIRFRAELKIANTDALSIQEIEAALSATTNDVEQSVALRFALAESYMKLKDHATAWRHWMLANRTERARLRYQPALDQQINEWLKSGFTQDVAGHHGDPTLRPIFIVGLPRTGTTLVERIIGSHSKVRMTGEIPSFQDSIGALIQARDSAAVTLERYFTELPLLSGDDLAREYRERSKPWRHDATCFTDKSLLNHLFVPLLLRAFPNAKVVHVRRHPMAATFAIFRTWFRGNFPFSYDLAEIAEYIIGYRQLMTHWKTVFGDRVHDVDYESVVHQQEPTTRSLLDYCGLEFEERCLQFQNNSDLVRTASYQQVREPVYDSSINAWRQFEAELKAVQDRFVQAGIDCA
jgi:tetratricopeptide (TPR) repeat protein